MAYANKEDNLEYQRNWSKCKYDKKRQLGLCGSRNCTKAASSGKTLCLKHCQRSAEYTREIRNKKRTSGICVWSGCAEESKSPSTMCGEHKKATAKQRRLKRKFNLDNNLCISCSQNLEGTEVTKCTECSTKARKRHSTLGNRFTNSRASAKAKGIDWDLTKEQYVVLAQKPCYYCNLTPEIMSGSGLDRIDSFGSYTVANLVSCCKICNIVKSDIFTKEEMLLLGDMIRKILNARKNASVNIPQ